jgi:hypothetical protein
LGKKINWLFYLAKPKSVKTYSGREIYNFKTAFLTFTLPSQQRHPTAEITSELFNQLLTELRGRAGMKNYVWRLEFQKNRNVHYHLVTDTYLDYHFVLKIWNRICDKAGYIQPYTDKFKDLSLYEYQIETDPGGKTEFATIAKRYAKGKKNKWKQPNSVDVKNVSASKSIRYYITKYFSKPSAENVESNPLDTAENSFGMRLWFCSQSLSKMEAVSGYVEDVAGEIVDIIMTATDLKTYTMEYAKLVFFDLKKLDKYVREKIERVLQAHAHRAGYSPG